MSGINMKIVGVRTLGCTALLIIFMAGSASAGKHKFINFDAPGARHTYAVGINDNNTVAGYFESQDQFNHGFIRVSDGAITTFDGPNAVNTWVTAINDADEIVGYFSDASDVFHGFVREPDGTIAVADFPNADLTFANGINKKGDITGEFDDPKIHGFLRKRSGKFRQFNVPGAGTAGMVINDDGAIAGKYCTTSCFGAFGAFVRTPNGAISTFSVSGAQGTLPFGLNKSGLIAGSSFDSSHVETGFLRTPDGQITTTSECAYTGLTNRGWAVGSVRPARVYHGCLRTPDGTVTTFDDPDAGTGDLQGTSPFGINERLYVAGDYQDSDGNLHGFMVHLRK
jgi:hypothetical protein